MSSTAIAKWEHTNEFFSIVIQETGHHPGSYVFSSGLSLPKFNPIIWGRTGICSNAAFKGLQQLRADVAYFALQRGISTGNATLPAPAEGAHGTGWYQESALRFEHASPEAMEEILAFSVRNLVQTILTACQIDVSVPAGLDPKAMQTYLASYGLPNYREAAPPPIAKPHTAAA
jgi:hypothetical protein